ncbi:MAG TPA: wax ester/triacylglycerol synthase family O-acyltransferase [Candidatus Binatia bacterium]|nr:wax ester/triacylglycerol synthase family O-acyltransferase [Candidatus Binatia bacterium]
MSPTWYERLTLLDHSFLAFEGSTTPMHIAALAVFDAATLRNATGGIDVDRIRRHVESRLQHIPRYRQRLAQVPIENRSVWVDDNHFELAYHIRQASVPRPGSDDQLREVAARLLERPLNRSRPLWEIWVIEGVERNRVALLFKVHHCMVDGVAGVEILAALLSPSPQPHIPDAEPWRPRPTPTTFELLSDEVGRRLQMSRELVLGVGESVRRLRRNPADLTQKLGAAWQLIRDSTRPLAATPINQRVGLYRRFHWVTHDLTAIKAIRAQVGGTVNEIVLAIVSGAVREFLQHRRTRVDTLDFRVAVPVNVRDPQSTGSGNRVSAWLFPLSIHERDPLRRLQAVRNCSGEFKDAKHALGGEVLTQAAEWTSANVLTFAALVTNQSLPVNMIVTNVPGPPIPLYLIDARMLAVYPHVPLFEHQCLGVALLSYAGKLHWGFNADFDVVPDLEDFAAAIDRSFRQLRRAALGTRDTTRTASRNRERRTLRAVARSVR